MDCVRQCRRARGCRPGQGRSRAVRWIGKHQTGQPKADVCEFEVIGELKSDDRQLLMRGCDGRFYSIDTASGHVEALDPDDSWALDVTERTSGRIRLPYEAVA